MEIWKDIIGYEGYYQVSNLGRVKGLQREKKHNRGIYIIKEKIKSIQTTKNGYSVVLLSKNKHKKLCTIHRLVASAFIENTENKKTVNHKDGNRSNNKIFNLEWNTYSENSKHGFSCNGRIPLYGEKCGASKYSKETIIKIKSLLKNYKWGDIPKLSKLFNIPQPTIKSIKKGDAWQWLKV